jgi:hypothetical protein
VRELIQTVRELIEVLLRLKQDGEEFFEVSSVLVEAVG